MKIYNTDFTLETLGEKNILGSKGFFEIKISPFITLTNIIKILKYAYTRKTILITIRRLYLTA